MKKGLLINPLFVQTLGFGYLFFCIGLLAILGYFNFGKFFAWGPPVSLLGFTLNSQGEFYFFWFFYFFHELINAWINQVVYPWIMNTVQDPKTLKVSHSTPTCLFLVSANSVYGTLDIVFIVSSIASQFSFVLALILAQVIAVVVITPFSLKNGTLPSKKI